LKTRYLSLCVIFGIILLFLVNPDASIDGARDGLSTWATQVVPSLLPFSVAANLLESTGITASFSRKADRFTRRITGFSGYFLYAFLTSALSGYPMGAGTVANLVRQKLVSREEGEFLLPSVSTSGPLFIMGTVAAVMLNNRRCGWLLLASHYASAMTVALIFGAIFRNKQKCPVSGIEKIDFSEKSYSFGNSLSQALTGGIRGMLTVGATMTVVGAFLYVVLAFLPQIPILSAVIAGIIEMATGCRFACVLADSAALPLISAIIGWGGLSVYLQSKSMILSSGLTGRLLLAGKVLQGIFAGIFALVFCLLFL